MAEICLYSALKSMEKHATATLILYYVVRIARIRMELLFGSFDDLKFLQSINSGKAFLALLIT